MSVTLYKMGEVPFHSIGGKAFNLKAENKRFTVVGSHCRHNFKFQYLTSSFDKLRQRNV